MLLRGRFRRKTGDGNWGHSDRQIEESEERTFGVGRVFMRPLFHSQSTTRLAADVPATPELPDVGPNSWPQAESVAASEVGQRKGKRRGGMWIFSPWLRRTRGGEGPGEDVGITSLPEGARLEMSSRRRTTPRIRRGMLEIAEDRDRENDRQHQPRSHHNDSAFGRHHHHHRCQDCLNGHSACRGTLTPRPLPREPKAGSTLRVLNLRASLSSPNLNISIPTAAIPSPLRSPTPSISGRARGPPQTAGAANYCPRRVGSMSFGQELAEHVVQAGHEMAEGGYTGRGLAIERVRDSPTRGVQMGRGRSANATEGAMRGGEAGTALSRRGSIKQLWNQLKGVGTTNVLLEEEDKEEKEKEVDGGAKSPGPGHHRPRRDPYYEKRPAPQGQPPQCSSSKQRHQRSRTRTLDPLAADPTPNRRPSAAALLAESEYLASSSHSHHVGPHHHHRHHHHDHQHQHPPSFSSSSSLFCRLRHPLHHHHHHHHHHHQYHQHRLPGHHHGSHQFPDMESSFFMSSTAAEIVGLDNQKRKVRRGRAWEDLLERMRGRDHHHVTTPITSLHEGPPDLLPPVVTCATREEPSYASLRPPSPRSPGDDHVSHTSSPTITITTVPKIQTQKQTQIQTQILRPSSKSSNSTTSTGTPRDSGFSSANPANSSKQASSSDPPAEPP